MSCDKCEKLEKALREIAEVAECSEGGEWYAMIAREALGEDYRGQHELADLFCPRP